MSASVWVLCCIHNLMGTECSHNDQRMKAGTPRAERIYEFAIPVIDCGSKHPPCRAVITVEFAPKIFFSFQTLYVRGCEEKQT